MSERPCLESDLAPYLRFHYPAGHMRIINDIIELMFVGAKLQATNRVPRPVDRGTATRYGG